MDYSDGAARQKACIIERARALATMGPSVQQRAALFAERNNEMGRRSGGPSGHRAGVARERTETRTLNVCFFFCFIWVRDGNHVQREGHVSLQIFVFNLPG